MSDEYQPLIPPVRPSFDRATIYRTHMIVTYTLVDETGKKHGERAVTVKMAPEDPVHVAFAAAMEAVSEQAKAEVRK
jgi:hypothetical protein